MKQQMYTGNIPTKGNYTYFSSVVIANRKWDIYVDKDTNPLFIYWKFVLTSGQEWHKANYGLMFSVEKDRLSKNKDWEKFLDEFPSHYLQYIEDVSRFFSRSFRSSLLELKSYHENPLFFDSVGMFPEHIGYIYLQDGERTTKWEVAFNKRDKRIHIRKAIPTKTPIHPLVEEREMGIKQYDFITFIYFIEEDNFVFLEEAEFLRYFPLEYAYLLKFNAQYIAFKFRHYWDS